MFVARVSCCLARIGLPRRFGALGILAALLALGPAAAQDDATAVVFGYVWYDTNDDGQRQPNEPLVNGGYVRPDPLPLSPVLDVGDTGYYSVTGPMLFFGRREGVSDPALAYAYRAERIQATYLGGGAQLVRPLTLTDLPEKGPWAPLPQPDEQSPVEINLPVRPYRLDPKRSVYYPHTGFGLSAGLIGSYFEARGGVSSFGYPVSSSFMYLGLPTQIFQRAVLQVEYYRTPVRAWPLDLLHGGFFPYLRFNGATIPARDEHLASLAPAAGDPGYAEAALEFVRQNAPDEWDDHPVRFRQTFLATAGSEAPPQQRAAVGLEVWGLPTSRPAYDPSNHSFVYQRFERGVMHYDVACACTQGLLLGDLFKAVLTGENLPRDLEQRARGSLYYRQYDPSFLNAVARPGELPQTRASRTNLAWAFLPPANASELRPATR